MTSLAYAALWFFVFSVPWENVIRVPGLGAVSRLTGIIALALALLVAVISGRIRRWHLFHVAALLFVIWAGAGVLLFSMETIPKKLWTYMQLFLVLWMMWELAPSKKRQLGLLTAYVFGASVSAISTIMVFRRSVGATRFAASGFDANDLAAALVLALPMAWYLGLTYHRPLLRWICRAYLPLGLVAIGLTGSRGGLIGTALALMIVPLSMTRLTPGKLVVALSVLCISGFLAVAYVPESTVTRLASTSTELEEGRLGGRVKIWVAGVRAFSHRPVLGYGTSGFRAAIAPYLPTVPQVAHNSYLSVLVEQGIVGFVLYLVMFGSVFRAVLTLSTTDRRFALVLLATLIVIMLPLAWEDRKPVWFILAALLGLARAAGTSRGHAQYPQSDPGRTMPAPPAVARWRQPLSARRNAERDATA